ncbi:hypothetical protein BGZ76_003973 [Entomortierella beljakovae]|nr:hypothetical protein BGZ76_003973 [Entomortierella beljakovae]
MSAKATRKRRQVESDLVLPSNSRRKATMTIEPTKTYEKTSRAKALGGGGIKHVYTEDQDRFLAEILADDHINLIIQGPGPINQTEVVEPEPGQGPEQEPELEPIHDLEEVEDEPEHENEAENEPEIDEIQSESDFPIIEHDIRATGKQKSDHYQSTSAYQPRMMENMDELELDSRSRHEVEKAGEGITEQELTKRVVAEYSQTTKREEFRIGLERDKERTKQLELENKQLELRLKIEQARFERIRLETDRERQQGRSFSLD